MPTDYIPQIKQILEAKGDFDFITPPDIFPKDTTAILESKNIDGVEISWSGKPTREPKLFYHDVYIEGHKPYERKLVIGTLLDKTNEWFLEEWIKFYRPLSDKIVILVDEEKGRLEEKNYKLLVDNDIIFKPFGFPWNESKCWSKLLYECLDFWPEWFFFTSSDEIYSDKFLERLDAMLNHPTNTWYGFPVYHFWGDRTHYRVDGTWGAGRNCNCLKIFRNVCAVHSFSEREWHGPAVSPVYGYFPGEASKLRIRHYGNVNPNKYKEKVATRGEQYSGGVDGFVGLQLDDTWNES